MPDHGEIAMAVYRPDAELLRRQLDSLRAQTVATWTCRVGIDGADPVTEDLVLGLVAGDARFTVVTYAENVGVYHHVERLIADAPKHAAWFALSDQDDRWHPDKLAQLTEALRDGVSAVSCQARVVDRDGVVLGRTDRRSGDLADLLLRNQLTGSLSLWRPDVLARALPFPHATDVAIHDHWLAVCAAALGEVVVLDHDLQDYVQHGANVIGEAGPTRFRDELRQAVAHGGVRGHLDHAADQRWQWRVSMAATLIERDCTRNAGALLADIAANRITLRLVRAVVRSVRRRRLRVRGAVGTLVAAGWACGKKRER